MNILDNYLNYLNEGAGDFIKSNIKSSAEMGLKWGLFFIPATILAWKVANAAFSGAVRKCGGVRSNTPGFQACVARERISALNKKIVVFNKILSGCHTAKDPELCKQKFKTEIEKAKNKIETNKAKIEDITGNTTTEQLGIGAKIMSGAAAVASTGIMLATGIVVDKAIFLVNRTFQAAFRQSVRKCGIYKNNEERNICMSKFKIISLTKKLNELKNISIKCNNSNNKNGCIEKVNKHIEKTNRDIKIEKDSILSYEKELESKKREEEYNQALKNKQL